MKSPDEQSRDSRDQKEQSSEHSSKARPVLKSDEWACVDPKCAYINVEKRNTCQSCGKAKPRAKNRVGREIGKEAAEKSKGLFSADDWVCTKCGNVNWARRIMCNICNAPKLADQEVRTGYGGGYMDRETVEYIQREDDEEFDEFGRKKRRRKVDAEGSIEEDKNEALESSVLDSSKLEQEFREPDCKEADESEEDEGDDADIDKYDLTADLELANFKVNIELLRQKALAEAANPFESGKIENPNSPAVSDCSCSCSGGICSCVESDEDDQEFQAKRRRIDLENDEAENERIERSVLIYSDGDENQQQHQYEECEKERADSSRQQLLDDDRESHPTREHSSSRRHCDDGKDELETRHYRRSRSRNRIRIESSSRSKERSDRDRREKQRDRDRHHRNRNY